MNGAGIPDIFPEPYGPRRFRLAPDEVFKLSVGTTTALVEGGWCGVVRLHYGEGWIEIDTRYHWTRTERLAVAGWLRRAWLRAVAR